MQTVNAYIEHHAANTPERTFVISPERQASVSFAEFEKSTKTIGSHLDRLGIARGAKVAFLLNNGLITTQLFLGVMANARVIVPLNAVAGDVQLTHVLGHSDAEIVLVAPEYREKLSQLLSNIDRAVMVIEVTEADGAQWPVTNSANEVNAQPPVATDPALLLYTSGSTGLPKGAIVSHRGVTSGGKNVAIGHGLTQDDRALCVLPVYHINGAMVTVMGPLVSGSSVVMPARFSVSTFWSLIAQHRCTWSSLVPTIIKYLLDRASTEPFEFGNDDRLKAFRFARSASAPLAATVLTEWETVFSIPMLETMGLTETAGTVCTNPMPPATRKPGSVGLPSGNEMIVVDDKNNECPPHQVGELIIRGDNLLDYYYKNPEDTESSLVDGWFRTGDLGMKDEEGYIFVTGRIKELIIRGGENIAPREIDDALYKHEAILEAAALGVDDESYGQEVIACVVLRNGYECSEEELKEHCITAIGKYKSPKVIHFMDDLPKGPSGKILRLKISEQLKSQKKIK
jgi:acyl-CoA synthetase (AMP-forming)/AMP-acid ligase II